MAVPPEPPSYPNSPIRDVLTRVWTIAAVGISADSARPAAIPWADPPTPSPPTFASARAGTGNGRA